MKISKLFFIMTVLAACVFMGVQLASHGFGNHEIGEIFFWMILLAAVELMPVSLGLGAEVTMGFPIRLALAILFRDSPGLAMLIVGLAAVDSREFRREIDLLRTLFNRSQFLLSVGAAALLVRALGDQPFDPVAISAAALAQVLTNLGLVAIALSLDKKLASREILSLLVPPPRTGFALSYVLLTALGVVTAVVDLEIGKWAVAAVLIPLLFARLSILGARRQEELSERIRKQQEDLLHATEKVFQEREAERHRIAEDIHDASLQLFTAASYSFRNASRAIEEASYDDARDAVVTAGRALDDGIDKLRDSLVDLRRASLEGGLMNTMHKYADELSTLWGTRIHLEGEIADEPPTPVGLAAFQIFQEALTNALKHANSQEVSVRVVNEDGLVHIVVEDKGEGFDTSTEAGPEHVGMGLMKERAARVGGRIELQSIPGEGTRVEAILPGGVAVNQ